MLLIFFLEFNSNFTPESFKGFQLSRYNYGNLDNLKAAVQRTQAAGIPLDIQYAVGFELHLLLNINVKMLNLK